MHVRLGLSKLISQLGKGEIAGVFLPASNFTGALLFSLNSLRFVGKGLTGIGLSLTVPVVMRPCDGASGMVRGNRRKAVFALKALACAGRAARRIRNHPLCGWGQPALQSRPLAGHSRLFRPQGIRVERAVVAYGPEGLQPVAHEVDVQVPRRVHAEV